MEPFQGITGTDLIYARKSLAGSMIGGFAEMQEVIDYCAARNIKADVEVIRPEDINKAFDRVVNKDVRDRFVIDIASIQRISHIEGDSGITRMTERATLRWCAQSQCRANRSNRARPEAC